MKNIILCAIFVMFLASLAFGQTLNTAETIGKDKTAVFGATSALVVKDFTTLTYSYGQIVRGVNNRVDLYAGAGITTALGQKQASITSGANINFYKSSGVSLSSFNLLSTAINRRGDASTLLGFTALIASKNFQIKKKVFTGYTGYSLTIPIGARDNKLFTPPRPVHNVPIGIMIPKGKLAFFAEYDFGKKVQVVALGVAFSP